MASIKIKLNEHKKLTDESSPIIMQLIKDRKKRTIWLKHYAKNDQWDFESNTAKRNHPNSRRLNLYIREKINEAEGVILDLEKRSKHFTVNDIVAKITKGSTFTSFTSYTKNIIDSLIATHKTGNARVYENTSNVFIKKFRNEKDINLQDIDYKCICNFQEYLQKEGRKVNTISVHLRTLRAVINKALNEDLISQEAYPFKKFKIKSESTQKRAISKENIDKIKKLDLDEGTELYKTRDYFLFSFYNRGMSFIDLAFLKVSNIQNDRIYYTRRKTGQKISIKITDLSGEIMRRYNDFSDPDSYIFPIINRKGQEYLDYRNAMRFSNKKLKKIATLAKIEETISTYTARHSWATVAKRSGIPTAVISEGMGHDSEKTTQIYLDSFENAVLDDANEKIIK